MCLSKAQALEIRNEELCSPMGEVYKKVYKAYKKIYNGIILAEVLQKQV